MEIIIIIKLVRNLTNELDFRAECFFAAVLLPEHLINAVYLIKLGLLRVSMLLEKKPKR